MVVGKGHTNALLAVPPGMRTELGVPMPMKEEEGKASLMKIDEAVAPMSLMKTDEGVAKTLDAPQLSLSARRLETAGTAAMLLLATGTGTIKLELAVPPGKLAVTVVTPVGTPPRLELMVKLEPPQLKKLVGTGTADTELVTPGGNAGEAALEEITPVGKAGEANTVEVTGTGVAAIVEPQLFLALMLAPRAGRTKGSMARKVS